MNFVHPQLLWLAPAALLLLAGAALYAASKRRKMLEQLLGQSAKDPRAVHYSPAKRKLRFILLAAVLLLLIAAAARPYRSSRIIPHQTFGRDILVLFDVSKSMWATDVAPSRLEHAKYLLRELVEKTGNDRFGIVAFAGRAFLACPLTSDKTTLEQYIDELGPSVIPIGGTNLELPVNIALDAFDAAAGNRAVLLMTDGDELSGNSAGAIAKLKERKIPLFILGLGDPRIAAPVPDEGGGFKRTAKGELATSRLNEEKLREFAAETGGIYVRSTVTDPGLAPIISRIDQLGRAEQESAEKSIPYDDFPLLLGAAALLLFLYLMTGERPFEWRGAQLLWLALPLLAVGATPAELYNAARESQLAGDKEAASLYEQAIREGVGDREVRSRALYNLGIGSHRNVEETLNKALESVKAQQLDPALKMLDEALNRIGDTEELYRQSLASSAGAPNNLARLASDRSRVEELKKKIEELKKQQEQAKKQAQQARDQNKQEQNQQDQKDQQGQQDQKDQQGQQGQQNKQDQQGQQNQQDQKNQQGQQDQKDQQGQQNQQNKQDQQGQQDQKDQQGQQGQQNQQNKQDQQGQQNQQGQKDQQSQQGQQNRQDQKDRQSQQGQQGRQDQKDRQNRPDTDQAIEQAKREAEQLKKQADELNQTQLSQQAEKARQELEKAGQERRNNRRDQAQKHLDEAARALSGNGDGQEGEQQDQQKSEGQKGESGEQQDQQKSEEQKGESGEQQDQQKSEEQKGESGEQQDQQKSEEQSAEQKDESAEGEEKNEISSETAEQLLQMMKDEEQSLRDRVNRGRGVRERKVEKDW